MQRAIRHKALEQRTLLEKFDEERQLAERGDRRAVVLFQMNAPGKSIGGDRPRSTTGCSPIGSAGKSLRFVLMAHDSNDFATMPQRQLTDLG